MSFPYWSHNNGSTEAWSAADTRTRVLPGPGASTTTTTMTPMGFFPPSSSSSSTTTFTTMASPPPPNSAPPPPSSSSSNLMTNLLSTVLLPKMPPPPPMLMMMYPPQQQQVVASHLAQQQQQLQLQLHPQYFGNTGGGGNLYAPASLLPPQQQQQPYSSYRTAASWWFQQQQQQHPPASIPLSASMGMPQQQLPCANHNHHHNNSNNNSNHMSSSDATSYIWMLLQQQAQQQQQQHVTASSNNNSFVPPSLLAETQLLVAAAAAAAAAVTASPAAVTIPKVVATLKLAGMESINNNNIGGGVYSGGGGGGGDRRNYSDVAYLLPDQDDEEVLVLERKRRALDDYLDDAMDRKPNAATAAALKNCFKSTSKTNSSGNGNGAAIVDDRLQEQHSNNYRRETETSFCYSKRLATMEQKHQLANGSGRPAKQPRLEDKAGWKVVLDQVSCETLLVAHWLQDWIETTGVLEEFPEWLLQAVYNLDSKDQQHQQQQQQQQSEPQQQQDCMNRRSLVSGDRLQLQAPCTKLLVDFGGGCETLFYLDYSPTSRKKSSSVRKYTEAEIIEAGLSWIPRIHVRAQCFVMTTSSTTGLRSSAVPGIWLSPTGMVWKEFQKASVEQQKHQMHAAQYGKVVCWEDFDITLHATVAESSRRANSFPLCRRFPRQHLLLDGDSITDSTGSASDNHFFGNHHQQQHSRRESDQGRRIKSSTSSLQKTNSVVHPLRRRVTAIWQDSQSSVRHLQHLNVAKYGVCWKPWLLSDRLPLELLVQQILPFLPLNEASDFCTLHSCRDLSHRIKGQRRHPHVFRERPMHRKIAYRAWENLCGSTVYNVETYRYLLRTARHGIMQVTLKLVNECYDERHNSREFPMCRPLVEFPKETKVIVVLTRKQPIKHRRAAATTDAAVSHQWVRFFRHHFLQKCCCCKGYFIENFLDPNHPIASIAASTWSPAATVQPIQNRYNSSNDQNSRSTVVAAAVAAVTATEQRNNEQQLRLQQQQLQQERPQQPQGAAEHDEQQRELNQRPRPGIDDDEFVDGLRQPQQEELLFDPNVQDAVSYIVACAKLVAQTRSKRQGFEISAEYIVKQLPKKLHPYIPVNAFEDDHHPHNDKKSMVDTVPKNLIDYVHAKSDREWCRYLHDLYPGSWNEFEFTDLPWYRDQVVGNNNNNNNMDGNNSHGTLSSTSSISSSTTSSSASSSATTSTISEASMNLLMEAAGEVASSSSSSSSDSDEEP